MHARTRVRFLIILLMILGCFQVLQASPPDSRYMTHTKYGNSSEIIIALHGSPGDKSDFELLGTELASQYTIYALDLPCFGEQGLMKRDCGIDGAADFVAAFMDEQGIARAHILGYSWGGGAAITFAAQYSERTKTLVLLDSMGIPEGEMTGSYMTERARLYISYPFVLYYPGVFGGNLSWRQGFMQSYRETDLRTIRSDLSRIEVPTLVLHGSRDSVIEPWVAEEHARLITRSELLWFNGTHGSIFSDVSEISPAIRTFIDKHTTKGVTASFGLTIQ